jgi:hypothetical protein
LAAALVAVFAVALWPVEPGEASPVSPPEASNFSADAAVAPLPVVARPPPASVQPTPGTGVSDRDVLAAALHEEMVPLASSVVIEDIERDRSWVCQGEPMGMAARFGGTAEPGAVYRWVWLTMGGEAQLHPGPALQWKAPERAGRYVVRFQVCKDLGGRRVGVLAERTVEIEVRACAPGERQEFEPLRLTMTQRGQGAYLFQALARSGERIEAYAWDFGDSTTMTTSEPRVEHTFPTQELGPQETRSFSVKLEARLSRGGPLSATAFVLVRGQPPNDTPHPVELEVSRWSPHADGGWRSEVVARSASGDISWDRLERVTQYWDGGVDISTRKWSEVIRVEEGLERGGFRGHVLVGPSEASPGTKQILDFLYGYDASGQEVVVSWSPFKSEPPALPREPVELPPGK